jgi:hypothetical protein
VNEEGPESLRVSFLPTRSVVRVGAEGAPHVGVSLAEFEEFLGLGETNCRHQEPDHSAFAGLVQSRLTDVRIETLQVTVGVDDAVEAQ